MVAIEPGYWRLIATISATMIGFVFIGAFYYLESGWKSFKYFQGDLEQVSKNYAKIIIAYFSTALALSVVHQTFFPNILPTIMFCILFVGAVITTRSLNSVFIHFETLFGENSYRLARWLNWFWFSLAFLAPVIFQTNLSLAFPSLGDIYLREDTAAWIVFISLGIGYWNLLLFLLTPYQMHKRERDEEARQNKLAAQQGDMSQTWDKSRMNHAQERVKSSLEEIGLTTSSDFDIHSTYVEERQLSGDLTEPYLRQPPKITKQGEGMAFVWIPDDWLIDKDLLAKSSRLSKIVGRAMWKGYQDLTGVDVRIFRRHQSPWEDTPSTDMLLKVYWEGQDLEKLEDDGGTSEQILEAASSIFVADCLFPVSFTSDNKEDVLDSGNDYAILDISDKSHGAAKRYSTTVIVQEDLSKTDLQNILPDIVKEVRKKPVHRNDTVEEQWGGKDAQIVWIHLFNEQKSPDEMIAVDGVDHYVGKAEWFDPDLDSRFTPFEMRDADGIFDNIRFKWSHQPSSGDSATQDHEDHEDEEADTTG